MAILFVDPPESKKTQIPYNMITTPNQQVLVIPTRTPEARPDPKTKRNSNLSKDSVLQPVLHPQDIPPLIDKSFLAIQVTQPTGRKPLLAKLRHIHIPQFVED